jgi:hypothetical protein
MSGRKNVPVALVLSTHQALPLLITTTVKGLLGAIFHSPVFFLVMVELELLKSRWGFVAFGYIDDSLCLQGRFAGFALSFGDAKLG